MLTAAVVIAAVIAAATAMIVAIVSVTSAAQTVDLAVGRTEDGAKAAAALRFCGRRKHIQREADIFEVSAGVPGNSGIGAGFRHTSAQRIDYHIHGAEQFYDGEQTDGNIDCHRGTHGCIAVRNGNGVTFTAVVVMVMAGVAAVAGIPQICLQGNGLTFCNGEGAAAGIAAAVVQISSGGNVSFCRAEQSYPQVVAVCGRDAADKAAIGPAEFQCIVEHIFQFQIPAAFLQRVGSFSENFNMIQFQIGYGDVSSIAGGHDDITLTEHIVTAVAISSGSTGRPQDIRGQAFLDAALIEDFLGNDTGFPLTTGVAVMIVAVVTVSCLQIKFKSSHKTASLKLLVFILIV